VITSSYDVARGQFSGGQIASTTRSGSNFVQGTFNYSLRDQQLAWETGDPTAFNRGYTQNQLSGGFGGPIVKDKRFVFGSAQARRRTDAVPSLVNADAAPLGRVGVSRDSVDRFLSIVQGFGLTPDASLVDSRDADNYSALMRLDWLASSGQTLTLRGDFVGPGRIPLASARCRCHRPVATRSRAAAASWRSCRRTSAAGSSTSFARTRRRTSATPTRSSSCLPLECR
jgi:hypothetical protein